MYTVLRAMADPTTAPTGTKPTMWELAALAAAYSSLTSAGFVVAVIVAWVLLARLAPGTRPVGNFGKFMIALEAVDAIPEAMVIAEATAGGRMTIAFAFSIFSLNLANTMATSMDFLATKPEKILHRILLFMIFFSVGSLSFSISSTVFASFLDNLSSGHYNWLHFIPLLTGVVVGGTLIWLLMMIEDKLHARELAKAAGGEDVSAFEDVLGPMRLSLEREEHHLEAARNSTNDEPSYHAQVVAHYEDRVRKIRELISSLESVKSLRESLQLPITQDAKEVVEDSLYDQLGMMEQSYLLAPKNQSVPVSLHKRAIQLLAIMCVLVVWAVLLTFFFTPLFFMLDEGTLAGYVNSFAEGLSGGAFLATISSTMIPRIQQDAYRSHWSRFAFRSVGMCAFILGLVFATLLETASFGSH